MWTFTLTISCLTTSNLPWFMDLTFQVPMQYCSLQHWTLLSPTDVATSEHHFHFSPATSFFLELLLIVLSSSPVAYWIPSNPASYLFAFSYCSWGSLAKISGVVCHFLLQWTIFCQNSPLWLVHLRGPCMAWFIASLSYTSPSPQWGCDPWRGKGHEESVIQAQSSCWVVVAVVFFSWMRGVCEEEGFCNSVFLNKLQHFAEGSYIQLLMLKGVPIFLKVNMWFFWYFYLFLIEG